MATPSRAQRLLEKLARLGVAISVDDFGAGYTSLGQLKDLPVRELKVDRSFVTTMTQDRSNALIVHSVVDLGHNLGLTIVAEASRPPRRSPPSPASAATSRRVTIWPGRCPSTPSTPGTPPAHPPRWAFRPRRSSPPVCPGSRPAARRPPPSRRHDRRQQQHRRASTGVSSPPGFPTLAGPRRPPAGRRRPDPAPAARRRARRPGPDGLRPGHHHRRRARPAHGQPPPADPAPGGPGHPHQARELRLLPSRHRSAHPPHPPADRTVERRSEPPVIRHRRAGVSLNPAGQHHP